MANVNGLLSNGLHGFGGEVNHSVDVVFGEESAYRIEIADVGTLENVVRFLLDVFEIREIAGIREFVED